MNSRASTHTNAATMADPRVPRHVPKGAGRLSTLVGAFSAVLPATEAYPLKLRTKYSLTSSGHSDNRLLLWQNSQENGILREPFRAAPVRGKKIGRASCRGRV